MAGASSAGHGPGQRRATLWQGQPAWLLESAALRTVMVPSMGAEIVSLVDRLGDVEWLAGPIPGRPVQPAAYGAPFEKQDMAGWDEMFPTIVACPYPEPGPLAGVPLPDHGEAWALPWTVLESPPDEVTLTLAGRALPYRLTRRARFDAPAALRLHYTLENLADGLMPYLWAAHPQFVAGPDSQIILPPQVTQVINALPASWGWGAPETRFGWPEALAVDGRRTRLDRVGPPSLAKARKFFAMPGVHPSWAALLQRESGHWVRVEWNPQELPYLGLWVDEGAVHSTTVVSPQPATGWYDNLALARHRHEVRIVPAGGTHSWALTVKLGSDGNPFPPVTDEAET